MKIEVSPSGFHEALAKIRALAPHAEKFRVQLSLELVIPKTIADMTGADAAIVEFEPNWEMWLYVSDGSTRTMSHAPDFGLDIDAALANLQASLPKPLTPEQMARKRQADALRAQADQIENEVTA